MTYKPGAGPIMHPDAMPLALFGLRGGLSLTKIAGGSIDVTDAANGSDTIDTIEVSTHAGEDLLGGDTVTWATSDAVFGALIAEKINEKAWSHHYWATSAAGVVYIWPQDGTATDTGTITANDTSFTATIVNMGTAQTFVAAARWPSGKASADAMLGAYMYQVNFDPVMRSLDSNWLLSSNDGDADGTGSTTPYLRGVELVLQTEDQTLNVYIGPEGTTQLSATPSDNDIEERTFEVLGCALGLQRMFLQPGAAQNPFYHLRVF